jgi:hypothetical protein
MRIPPPGKMYPVPAPKKINFLRLVIVAFLLFGGIAVLADVYPPAAPVSPAKEPSSTPKTVEVGVNAADVIRLIGKRPDRINRTETAAGTTEQWVFENGRNYMYVYLRNNIVTAIQKSW